MTDIILFEDAEPMAACILQGYYADGPIFWRYDRASGQTKFCFLPESIIVPDKTLFTKSKI
jgi:hypothetical protein